MNDFTQQDNIRVWWSIIRDILAFFGGMAVIAYETAWASADRPWLLIIAIGMMGIPFASKADDWISGKMASGERQNSKE
jgi:hypothetical protein